jgi:hypothetical protein
MLNITSPGEPFYFVEGSFLKPDIFLSELWAHLLVHEINLISAQQTKETAMLTNSKPALSLSLALGLATMGLTGIANAKNAQPLYQTIQDDGNRDSMGLAPVYVDGQHADRSAASAFASAARRGTSVVEPEYQRYQDWGNRDSNGF